MSNKVEEFLNGVKVGELIRSNKEEERKHNKAVAIIAIVSVLVIMAVVAYTVYKLLTPNDDEYDFEDDFEDDFDESFNDFDEDDDEDVDFVEPTTLKAVKPSSKAATEDDIDEDEDL